MRIIIKDLFNSSTMISTEKGIKLYEKIIANITDEDKIILDFEGIRSTTTAFFFAAYGQLLGKYKKEELKDKIEFINIKNIAKQQIEAVLETSTDFYEEGE